MARWDAEKQQWAVSDAELDAIVAKGELRTAELREQAQLVVVTSVRYLPGERRVRLELVNGTTFIFPVDQVQGLDGAADEDLFGVEIWGTEMVVWPALDVHVSVTSLLTGIFGSRAWMADVQRQRGLKGGLVRSAAKAEAARANGKKGGRPKRTAP